MQCDSMQCKETPNQEKEYDENLSSNVFSFSNLQMFWRKKLKILIKKLKMERLKTKTKMLILQLLH